MDVLKEILLILGTVSFSISGALSAIRKKMDVFGVSMVGAITAIGGGIIRDTILGNTPPLIFETPEFVLIAIGVPIIIFIPAIRKWFTDDHVWFETSLLIADSIGLGIFTVNGVETALFSRGCDSFLFSMLIGVLTGVGGGVLRDILIGERPYIFMKHFYACAALVGAAFCYLTWPVFGLAWSMLIGGILIIGLRLLAAKYHWGLPHA